MLAGKRHVEIRLVSRDNFFLFTQCSTKSPRAIWKITNIVNPLRKLLRRVEVLVGDVDEIDLPKRRVLISECYRNVQRPLDYDHVVIAWGVGYQFL
jgi:NADH dehydrogenase FAD-containing subunit